MKQTLRSLTIAATVGLAALGAAQAQLTPVNVTPPHLSNADAGSLPGNLVVNPDGAASYSIPIDVPPGTGGLAPKLSLSYSSSRGNGIVGLGWSLAGLSSIHRCNKTIAQDGTPGRISFDTADRLCLDGSRLILATSGANPASDASYWSAGAQYRTEQESFARVTRQANGGFKVELKDGRIRYFGTDASSYISAQGRSDGQALLWALAREEDRFGNYLTVQYSQSAQGEYLATQIRYGGNGNAGQQPDLAVRLLYEARPDAQTQYTGGSRNDLRSRLTHVQTYTSTATDGSGGSLVRDYTLHYVTSSNTGRSMVDWVQACAINPQSGASECLPKSTFTWGDAGAPSFRQSASFNVPYFVGTYIDRLYNGNLEGRGLQTYIAAKTAKSCASGTLSCSTPGLSTDDKKSFATFTGELVIQLADGRTINRVLPNVYWDSSQVTGLILADIDGDGRDDLILTSSIPGGWAVSKVCLTVAAPNNEIAFNCFAWNQSMPSPYTDSSLPSVVDMRGDHRKHLMFGPTLDCYYNGSGMQCDTRQLVDNTANPIYGGLAANQFFRPSGLELSKQDVSDFYSVWKNAPNTSYEGVTVCVNKASIVCKSVFQAVSPTWQSGAPPMPALTNIGAGDLNGDGLTDFIYRVDNTLNVCLSKEADVDCRQVTPTWPTSGAWYSLGVGDYFGDGITRLVVMAQPSAPSYAGSSIWACRWADIQFACQQIGNSGIVPTANSLGNFDVDGSGTSSFVFRTPGSLTSTTNPAAAYSLYQSASQDRIVAAVNGIGSRDEVDYVRGNDTTAYRSIALINGSEQWPAYPLVSRTPGTIVKQLRRTTGQGTFLRSNFHYEGASVDASGRGPVGFALTQVTDDFGTTTVSTLAQAFPFTAMPKTTRKTSATGVILEDSQFTLDRQFITLASGAQTSFASVKQVVATKKDLDGSDLGTSTTVSTYGDGWGNLTSQTVTTVGAGSTFTTTTNTTYLNDSTQWLLGLAQQSTTTKTDPVTGTLTRTVSRTFNATTGALASETAEPGTPSLQVTSTLDRSGNLFGLVNKNTQSWTDPFTGAAVSRVVSDVTYDTKGRFGITLKNALGHTETRTYAAGSGAQTGRVDPNGQSTTWTVDGFGRISRELRPDGNEARRYVKACQGDCPAYAVVATISDTFNGGSRIAVPQVGYTDAAGHVVRSMTYGFDGRQIVTDSRFDAYGRATEADLPRYVADAAYLDKRLGYDALSRTISMLSRDESGVDRTSTTQYQGLNTIVTNPKNQSRTETRNVLGQLVQVRDAKSGLTKFSYDPFGNLSQTTDPNGNVISVSYDRLGRKTDLRDPNLGWIHYDVDPLGRTWKQTSPRQRAAGQATRSEFDVLDRMTGRYEPDLESHWVFDTAAYGIGQLAEAYTGTPASRDYRRLQAYDSLARPSLTSQVLTDATYTDRTEYDAWARVTRKTYQRGSDASKAYTYVYNAFGHNSGITRAGVSLWQANSVDAAGRITQASLGNGLSETHTYSPYSTRLASSLLLNAGGTARLQEGYLYDSLGSVTQRYQYWDAAGFLENFSYDELNRITVSQVTGYGQQVFTYDAAGNMLTKTGVGTGAYVYPAQGPSSVLPHAVQSIPGVGSFGYDANGNLTTGAGRTASWSSFDMPVQITKGSSSSSFVYGPEHQRARQIRSDGLTTIYAGSQEVENRGGQITVKTYWPSSIGVEIDRPGQATELNWTHTDRLGSPVALTDINGNFREKLAFDAWGKRRTLDGGSTPDSLDGITDNRGFTGHEMLDLLDLVHMNGRVYDPFVAKFLSGDPLVQDPTNGQNYGRYAYVLNNPTNQTDPTGFACEGANGGLTINGCGDWRPMGGGDSFREAALRAKQDAAPTSTATNSGAAPPPAAAAGAPASTSGTTRSGETNTTAAAEAAARARQIQSLDRAFEKAQESGNIAEMKRISESYQGIVKGDPQSAPNIIRMQSAIGHAIIVAGGVPGNEIAAPAAGAAMGAGMIGSPAPVALGKLAPEGVGRLPGPATDMAGNQIGRIIVDSKGNAMIEPVGGKTVAAGKGGVDTHTLYPNGSNYQRLNPQGHANNPTPHGHGHAPGTGPGMKGQGPSLDVNGNVVPWNSPAAHWPIN